MFAQSLNYYTRGLCTHIRKYGSTFYIGIAMVVILAFKPVKIEISMFTFINLTFTKIKV